jgi:hypothetical protein
VIKQADTQGGI